MSHLVLYRSFRPKTFEDVIGQDHIIQTLKNQVSNQSFGHAYLFCGTRGTGKTSTAKIFARAINCENNINGSPCGKCPACLSNLNGGNLDIVEIDAASNNRVDEIRDLREKIGYLPSVNKYKVYIVDEVHMLTDSAFNALLKTLEEPPSHAVFILATTEPHKLPATILSRCMRFDFKLVSEEDLSKHLENVFSKSGIKSDKESLKLIASAGNGSVRDTLSIAEMCSAYSNNNITYEKCLECLGVTSSSILIKILSAILSANAKDLIQTLSELKKEGKNFSVLVNDLIGAINAILTIKITNNPNEILSLPSETFESYKKLSEQTSENNLVEMLKKLADLDGKLKMATNIEMLIETTLLGMIFTSNEIENLKNKLMQLEKQIASGVVTVSQERKVEKPIEPPRAELKKVEPEKVEMQASPFDSEKPKDIESLPAKKLLGELAISIKKKNNMMLYSMLADVNAVELNGNELVIYTSKITADALNFNIKQLLDHLNEINPTLTLKVVGFEKAKNEPIEDFLRAKFGDKLTII